MDSASAAECHSATELRPGHAEHVAQYPEQRGVTINVDTMRLAVDFNSKGHGAFLSAVAADLLRANSGHSSGRLVRP
jgi:hypothetical protein